MILYPAIDLKNGQCVRLRQGDMAQATVFNDSAADQALAFERQGFKALHIVDLDGAFAGKPMNAAAVDAVLKTIRMPVQLGGGIRDLGTVEGWLAKGIARDNIFATQFHPEKSADHGLVLYRNFLSWTP